MNMRAIPPFDKLRASSLPMILRNLRQIKIDKFGYPLRQAQGKLTEDGSRPDGWRDLRWFVPIPGLPVWEFELYFKDSYRLYGIEYIRARDMRTAKRKIKRQYPHVVRFKWDSLSVDEN